MNHSSKVELHYSGHQFKQVIPPTLILALVYFVWILWPFLRGHSATEYKSAQEIWLRLINQLIQHLSILTLLLVPVASARIIANYGNRASNFLATRPIARNSILQIDFWYGAGELLVAMSIAFLLVWAILYLLNGTSLFLVPPGLSEYVLAISSDEQKTTTYLSSISPLKIIATQLITAFTIYCVFNLALALLRRLATSFLILFSLYILDLIAQSRFHWPGIFLCYSSTLTFPTPAPSVFGIAAHCILALLLAFLCLTIMKRRSLES
jgi:hypothetical protein